MIMGMNPSIKIGTLEARNHDEHSDPRGLTFVSRRFNIFAA